MHQDQSPGISSVQPTSGRRGFLKKAAAVFLGVLSMVAPLAAGLMVVLDPLRRKLEKNAFILVTSLRSVPEDGLPRKFTVVASHSDAWNRDPSVPIGAVYLRRTGPNGVQAFNVVCPHAGCFVDFVAARKMYICPCHNSTFGLNGSISDPKSPSPRGLDELEVQIRNDNEVWVKFENFLAGHEKRIPVA
jgi:menaquinol-cytochrome c reductase iron-sulfur subunit